MTVRHLPGSDVALDEPDHAVLDYLQTLLDEIPQGPEPASGPDPVPAPEPTPAAPVALEAPAPVPPPATAPQVETATEVRPVAAEIPGWAREPFQVLCFTADGVELGLPLIAMRGIVRLEGTLTRLPGLPPWHLGLLLARGEKVAIADLGWLLREGAPARRKGGSAYVLLLDGASWGLACESLGEARRVDAGAVRWRRGGSRAPLVRGVIRDDLRPVLAAEEILARLNGG